MTVLIESYKQSAAFRPEKFNPVVIAENQRVKVIEACFESGQFIPVHQPDVDLTLVVLEGSGTLATDGREQRIVPGTLAFIPAGESRGLKADTRLILLHVVTPSPGNADHVQVVAGLAKGAWK